MNRVANRKACYVSPESLEPAKYDGSSVGMAPYNKRMRRTVQNVTHLACAKYAPFCPATDARR